MSNTRIVVIKRRQLLYTGIVILLVAVALLLLIFLPRKEKTADTLPQYNNINNEEAKYTAGVYTSVISLNDSLLNLEVIVDKNHINSICISNLDDAVTTMYPLVEPALEKLAQQLYLDVEMDRIQFSEDSKYTQTLLLNAIKDTLAKAEIKNE